MVLAIAGKLVLAILDNPNGLKSDMEGNRAKDEAYC